MAAPIRNRAKPNHKFIMEGEKRVDIIPVFYWGKYYSHGNYMAGCRSDNQELLRGNDGKPYPYNQINLPNWEN